MKKELERSKKSGKISIYGIEHYNKNSKVKDYKIELDYKIWMVFIYFIKIFSCCKKRIHKKIIIDPQSSI